MESINQENTYDKSNYEDLSEKLLGTDNKDTPSSSGMVSPQERKGDILVGKTKVRLAMNVLGQALEKLGVESKEGKRVLATLNSLSDEFGDQVNSELVPSQILELVRGEASLQRGQPIDSAMNQQSSQQQPNMQQSPMLAQLAKSING